MAEASEVRPGELAIALPETYAAGIYFIGRIRTPFKCRDDCPKNSAQSTAVGRVELDPRYALGLKDLEHYSHIHLLYSMHESRRDLLLQVPAHVGRPRGTFALRSPVRPNRIALATVELLKIEDVTLTVRSVDCVDGTPLLDIKPYFASVDSFPHALPPLTRPSDGLPVGAVHGFCSMLWKLLQDARRSGGPTHIAVIFDASEKTFRNEIYKDYKAHRPPAPEELVPQFPLIREAVKAFNIACIEQDGFEADDLIATYAKQTLAAAGDVTVVSSDKDLMQLVRPGISMLDTMKNRSISPEQVRERFGVGPERVTDVQALAGDSVDNVPGVPGIGVKTAAELINEYGDLEALLSRAAEIKQPKRRERLTEYAIQARLSLDLVT